MEFKSQNDAIRYLRSTRAVRERCQQIYTLVAQDRSEHFSLNDDLLPSVIEYVVCHIKENYPSLDIPYHSRWRHFEAGGIDRTGDLLRSLNHLPALERGRLQYELVITSVLLDAGAGPAWRYRELRSEKNFSRSEGLGIASFHAYIDGAFSANPTNPLRADVAGLKAFSDAKLGNYFQISADNPMVGASGRAALIRALGAHIEKNPKYFSIGSEHRLGGFFDHILSLRSHDTIAATDILTAVLSAFQGIWPGRILIDGENLGDVWRHKSVNGPGSTNFLVPFHKLSQWLTYSLIEPLEDQNITVTGLHDLTGLPEYRNGGLLLDSGILQAKHRDIYIKKWSPGDEPIVEWRALTVCLLDEIGRGVAAALGKSQEEFPLARVLQGGTWSAGRKIASEKRPDGAPPITIDSDGTVF